MLSAVVTSVRDLEAHAAAVLPKQAYDYYRSGADDMISLADNMAAFKKYRLRPRVMVDVSNIDMSTSLQNGSVNISMPICLAPTAMHRMAHHDGEIATARAAANVGTLMCLSSLTTTPMEQVAEANGMSTPRWYQLYVWKDRQLTETLIRRAEKSGYLAIVITVDAPFLGKREADKKNSFALPQHLRLANFTQDTDEGVQLNKTFEGQAGLQKYFSDQIDPSLEWKDINWVTKITKLPVIVKGVVTKEDTELAIAHGVAGIWVSNHGARQLDTVAACIDSLDEVVRAAKGAVDVYVDGGFRRGTDVFKALALGAKAVFVGRPVLWGLAYKGQEGIETALKIMKEELHLAMALTGVTKISDINRSYIIMPDQCARCKM
eukprot:TRINITY_DN1424_c0_g1_i3.p1 TRINITY_DN1424_c0_g1~~TRINITY_DN1424_c0_g1_i3.p1  ORF type:complete len:377 (+),score=87.00 TRINITY_DN1424_c0_g1_i3:521-1651(+)